jgi:hypothetical protein
MRSRTNAMRYGEEPLSFTLTDVVTFLEDTGRPRFADFVKQIQHMQANVDRQRHYYERVIADLTERLRKYEPPQRYSQPTFQPPPEASD